jgi:LysR family transcriptional regulator for metE and metH
MSPFLDSRHLRVVAEVARAESVTRAADRLHVTQSAVSHQLRELEDKLGTAIFVRSGRRMLLTPAGRLLVEAAGGVLDAIGEVEAKVSQLARNIAGELRVSAHCHTGYHWLPALIDGLRRRYPAFEVRILPEYTLNPIGALLDAKLDLAIMNDDSNDRRLRYRELFDDEQVAVVHPGHEWAARAFVAAEDLAAEQLYLYSRSIDDSFIVQKVLRPAGIELRRVTYLQLTEGILEMIRADKGVSVLPTWSIANVIASGDVRAIRITRSGVFRKWYAATLSGIAPTPFLEEFIRLLIKQGPAARKVARRRHSPSLAAPRPGRRA